jgi:hypothetical protein
MRPLLFRIAAHRIRMWVCAHFTTRPVCHLGRPILNADRDFPSGARDALVLRKRVPKTCVCEG